MLFLFLSRYFHGIVERKTQSSPENDRSYKKHDPSSDTHRFNATPSPCQRNRGKTMPMRKATMAEPQPKTNT